VTTPETAVTATLAPDASLRGDALRDRLLDLRRTRLRYSGLTVAIAALVLVWGLWRADGMNSGGFLVGLPMFFDYPAQIVGEAWEAGLGAMLGLMVRHFPSLIETLNIAFVATILGGLVATILSLLASANLGAPAAAIWVTRRAMDVMRAFPELVIALFLIFLLGASPVPAMIAVAFHTSGALGKLFSEVNENIDRKPVEGLEAVGANWLQRLRFGVIPQVIPNYFSYFLLRLEINVRASAILGFVGAGGLGSELAEAIGWGQGRGDDILALFTLLFLAIIVIDQTSSAIRARLTGGAVH
jgi:phosphonate transport system permease protein